MSFTPEQQALVWRIGERIADEVEKVAAGRQSDCEAAAGDIYAMLATAPGAEACEWPNGRTFGFHDDPGEHDPCYVIMPDGAMLPFNHHAAPGVDIARARFVQAACNAALASSTPESSQQPAGEEYLEFKEALDDVRGLRAEYECLNGGGPGWGERNRAAWARVDELFANEDEAAYDRQQEDAHG